MSHDFTFFDGFTCHILNFLKLTLGKNMQHSPRISCWMCVGSSDSETELNDDDIAYLPFIPARWLRWKKRSHRNMVCSRTSICNSLMEEASMT